MLKIVMSGFEQNRFYNTLRIAFL